MEVIQTQVNHSSSVLSASYLEADFCSAYRKANVHNNMSSSFLGIAIIIHSSDDATSS